MFRGKFMVLKNGAVDRDLCMFWKSQEYGLVPFLQVSVYKGEGVFMNTPYSSTEVIQVTTGQIDYAKTEDLTRGLLEFRQDVNMLRQPERFKPGRHVKVFRDCKDPTRVVHPKLGVLKEPEIQKEHTKQFRKAVYNAEVLHVDTCLIDNRQNYVLIGVKACGGNISFYIPPQRILLEFD